MDIWFVCGLCDEDCIVFCPRTGFWGTQVEDPEIFWCHACGGRNTTPGGEWTRWDG